MEVPDLRSPSRDWFHLQHREHRTLVQSPADGAPLSASVFNLLNATVACGTLGLPLAFSQMGFGLAVATLVVMAAVNYCTTVMMARVGIAEGTKSYDNTVARVLGTRALHAFQFMMIAGQLGTLLSYFILIGDFAAYVGGGSDFPVCVSVRVCVCTLLF